MKKIVFSIIALLTVAIATAQNAPEVKEVPEGAKQGWTRGGNFSFLFNQSAFNNDWLGGGVSNMAGNVGVNYDFNYINGDWTWDNKFIMAYGLTKIKSNPQTLKTDDRIEINSLIGKKAFADNWYYSFFMNFRTQMDSGFVLNADGSQSNVKNSHFFSPAFLQFGPGLLWKKHDNLKVNIAPATSKLIFVHEHFTQFGPSFGVLQGDTSRFEFGAAVNAYYKVNLMENISVENILNLYSNYLEDPQNVDIDYTLNLVMTINKYISANVSMQAIYDDNTRKAFQVREVFGLGLNYNF